MESSERNDPDTPEDPQNPFPQCCGGDFTPLGAEGGGCSPGRFMADRASSTNGATESKAPCPMMKMCDGMMKGGARGLGLLLLVPALVLLSLGAAILLVPQILTWLVAAGLIAVGVLVLVSALFVRRATTAA